MDRVLLPALCLAPLALSACRFDTAGVEFADARTCGDARVNPGEDCDGENLDGKTCADHTGHLHGEIDCRDDCTVDVSACHTCGDDTRDADEECDGIDLDDMDCELLGHSGGTLRCATDCAAFNTSGCVDVPPDWYDLDWDYRRSIRVRHENVGDDLDSFPLLVHVADSSLGGKTHLTGDDILFTEADGRTRVPHEIEWFDGLQGEVVAWVGLPTLHAASDTVIYLYYGNPSSSPQATPEQVWAASYQGVWHLAEAAADELEVATHLDASGNQNHGLQSGNHRDSGRIAFGQRFDGDDDEIEVGNPDTFVLGNASCTISAWIRTTTDRASGIVIKSLSDSHVADDKLFGLNHTDGKLGIDHGWVTYLAGLTDINDGDWHHVAWVQHGDYSATDELWELYVDGAYEASTTASTAANLPAHTLRIGSHTPSSFFAQNLRGDIDEVRISHTTRSLAWLAASHANQHEPGAFYDLGAEESLLD